MQLLKSSQDVFDSAMPVHFGALLKLLRNRSGISQSQVLAHLPNVTQRMYSGIEQDKSAPAFDDLESMYLALRDAGVQLTLQDRQWFLILAQQKLASKKTHKVQKPPQQWEELRLKLVRIDGLPDVRGPRSHTHVARPPSFPQLTEIRHLVGREEWFASLLETLKKPLPKKLVVLQGPSGIGKTSELHRLANSFLQSLPRSLVILCELPDLEQETLGPEMALKLLMSEIVEMLEPANAATPSKSMEKREEYVLECLAKATRSVMILLDNAEQLLDEDGELSQDWQHFLTKYLQSHHSASLILATKEWRGWFTQERVFVHQTEVPSLSPSEGSFLLQRLGLEQAPEEQLQAVVAAVGGVPRCLEWVVSLTQQSMLSDSWSAYDFDDDETMSPMHVRSRHLLDLLEDHSLFGGPIAIRLKPLLERLLKRLSAEARLAMEELALTSLPLGRAALEVLCHHPAPLKELQNASLLTAYPKRVQLLPMVASLVRRQLSASQVYAGQEHVLQALTQWLRKGITNNREQGAVITEVARLQLRHYRLLAAAELVLSHGWLSFHAGHILRLARYVQQVFAERPWTNSPETPLEAESGALLLHYYLAPSLGETIDAKKRVEDYKRMYAWVTTGQLQVETLMEVHLLDHIMLDRMNDDLYEEAQGLLDGCFTRMEPFLPSDAELHATLLSKRASLYSEWSGYAEAHGQLEEAKRRRTQTIGAYEESFALLQRAEHEEGVEPLRQSTLKKKQASVLNNLSYQLNRAGRFTEALERVNHCIDLKEQGYADLDSLAASYGEKSQILAALGAFREALVFDEKAREEIGHSADAGDTRSQADRWIYQVNQGRLALLLGRADEAERLLREALSQKTQRRRIYAVLAEEALKDIKAARAASPDGRFQLDWRWVHRYRELSAFDAYWYWAPAGPFTLEEQLQWDAAVSASEMDDATKERLREILVASRERELGAAEAVHREPRLSYPALDITDVRKRITDFLHLDAEITVNEPNVVVRRLYHGAIEDQVCFLRLIEATDEGERERFWELTRQLYPEPTTEEMSYALQQVRQLLYQGLNVPESQADDEMERGRRDARIEACQRVIEVLSSQFHIALDVTRSPNESFVGMFSPPADPPLISAQGAKRFFEAVLQSHGYQGWQVIFDPNVQGPRVESGLRHVFLPAEPIPLDELREYVSHELAGHVARSIAGENSLLGLLGISTKGYMVTEEGLADYYERQAASLETEPIDDSGIWLGTLSIGLACGVAGRAQTFSSLFAFFEPLLLLYRLLWRDDEDRQTAERRAKRNAFNRCLRTFRGVPDLHKAGICNTKDVVYLRGRWLIDQAVAQDETVLDRLAVGKVAYELLPELEKLGITSPTQSFRTLVSDPHLDEYIVSFDEQDKNK